MSIVMQHEVQNAAGEPITYSLEESEMGIVDFGIIHLEITPKPERVISIFAFNEKVAEFDFDNEDGMQVNPGPWVPTLACIARTLEAEFGHAPSSGEHIH
jgi:hypothetical protein